MKIWHNSWGYQAELEQNSGAYLADLWISGFPHREFWKPVRWMLWLGFGVITKQAEVMRKKHFKHSCGNPADICHLDERERNLSSYPSWTFNLRKAVL